MKMSPSSPGRRANNIDLFAEFRFNALMNDTCQRFLFESTPVRGELVHLNDSFYTIMEQHQYPQVIRSLLGEALLSAVLLAETIKFDGQLTLQFQSDGPVSMLVAKCDSKGNIRGLAQWADAQLPGDVASALGEGQLVVTIEYDNKVAPYQSIIPIHHQTVTQALEVYFMQSEQLPTRLYVCVNERSAAGMLLQALPGESQDQDANQNTWTELVLLSDTLSHSELLELSNKEVLHRLFHEHDVRLFDSKPIQFKCTCTISRMQNAIMTLGEKEANDILRTNKEISVTCEYCNNEYTFDKSDVAAIFRRH